MRFSSEPKALKQSNTNLLRIFENDDLLSQLANYNTSDFSSSLKPVIGALIDYNLLQGRSNLQNKIDYYITPYNKQVDFKPSMHFEDKLINCKNLEDVAKKDWKLVSNFILKTDKKEFRNKLGAVNKELYLKIKDLAFSICKRSSPSNPTRNSESTKNVNNKLRGLCRSSKKKQAQNIFQKCLQESFESIKRISTKDVLCLAETSPNIPKGELRNLNLAGTSRL
eukprot:CAMPEP_0168336434 /NCGR_PEP_ID=MMETSP0213-20121227/11539_1 /TAXON_ID=151035 /ORGANISM="Euplotes harpa, Strain FSP1.4" /LENGTH=223 /DNA_ID=CAMNT_0008341625 /DNA_START=89 /DNA_END=760 /DNA_ORIENTATION=+